MHKQRKSLNVSAWLAAAACGALLGGILVTLSLLFGDTPNPRSGIDAVATAAGSPPPAPRAYEEDPKRDVSFLEKRVDQAILSLVREPRTLPTGLTLLDVRQLASPEGDPYHMQTLGIHLPERQDDFPVRLKKRLMEYAPSASLEPMSRDEWKVVISGLTTHHLIIFRTHGPPAPAPPQSPKAFMALVIDDIGEDPEMARQLARLDFPLTFAVWPHSSFGPEISAMAREFGLDVLVHQPMQPRDETYDPGPGAVFVDMTASEISRVVSENLDRVPGAVGLNNHMGSRFTESREGMRLVLTELKKRNMFFLDSRTTGRSVAVDEARRLRVPYFTRNIFLDNVRDVEAIVHQLQKAERLAMKSGFSIGIGHPYPATLEALRVWHAHKDPSVRVVPLRKLPRGDTPALATTP